MVLRLSDVLRSDIHVRPVNCNSLAMSPRVAILTSASLVFLLGNGPITRGQQPERLIDSIQGPQLYHAYCAVCHGEDAKGQGPMAKTLRKLPPDLTRYSARHGGKFSLIEVRKIISGTNILNGGHGRSGMPIWGPIFSEVTRDEDLGQVRIDNLARYLESIQRK